MNDNRRKPDYRLSREVTPRVISAMQDLLATTLARLSEGDTQGEAYRFPYVYMQEVFTSKYVDKNTDPADVRRSRAIVKWLGVEQRNRKTNVRLYETDPRFVLGKNRHAFGWQLLLEAAKQIKRVIGASPPPDLFARGGFSGGASTSRKKCTGVLFSKFVGSLDSTNEAWKLSSDVFPGFVTWVRSNPELLQPRIVEGNVLFTVPKTAVIDRVACKEPDVNIFLQKSVGDFIRRRLKQRAFIDLNDQSINRDLARLGSINGRIATIDLSSASDSLCTSLVHILLPHEWFKTLDALRCDSTLIDNVSHKNEMFSSMGNGFTFELESLVFWALARATCYLSGTKGKISVFGDDIIIPSTIAGAFICILSWVGFKTNETKTFVKGPFRESCGGHYWRGLDVTPFYIRAPIRDVSDMILFLNQLRAWIIRTQSDELFDGWNQTNPWVSLWRQFSVHVPKPLWGGYYLESRTQLVSNDPQKCELLQSSRIWKAYEDGDVQLGHYLSRLCEFNKLDRDLSHIETFEDSSRAEDAWENQECSGGLSFGGLRIPIRKYVMRRAKVEPAVFGVVRPLFVIEQDYRRTT